jgi:hypothetical protein
MVFGEPGLELGMKDMRSMTVCHATVTSLAEEAVMASRRIRNGLS